MNTMSVPVRAALIMAIAGLISGILSYFVTMEFIEVAGAPMAPALYFGIVLAFGVYYWETRNLAVALMVIVGVAIGWWCAVIIAGQVFQQNEMLAGTLAGFVGSAITGATLWAAAKDFRSLYNIAAVVGFGTLAGLLVAVELLPLFAVWQAGVAGLVGYAVALNPRPAAAALAMVNK